MLNCKFNMKYICVPFQAHIDKFSKMVIFAAR